MTLRPATRAVHIDYVEHTVDAVPCSNAEAASLGSLVSELDDSAPGDATPARDALRAVLAEVFNAHDFNKDGRMDVQEFRAAMRSMGDELSARVRVVWRPLQALQA